jgi:low affinity Fe/Cu permease
MIVVWPTMPPVRPTQMKSSGSAPAQTSGRLGSVEALFSRFARNVSALTAHSLTFAAALASVIVWAMCGPAAHYSENWQLWINTSTTILTFLMVFLLQNAQMRDTRALHIKMDELLRAVQGARNEMIDLENLSEGELEQYAAEFKKLHLQYADAISRKRPVSGEQAPAKPPSANRRRAAGPGLKPPAGYTNLF